jgi:hypothetical protein
VEKEAQKMYVGYFNNFQKSTQSKQSPNWRKFVQSGHPAEQSPGDVASAAEEPYIPWLPDFFGTNIRNWENIPNDHKLPIPNGHKLFQMVIKYSK